MTTLLVGPADGVTDQQLRQMTQIAADRLDGIGPIPVTLGKILYHAEAITLAVMAAASLDPSNAAAIAATEQVDIIAADRPDWIPHVTLCYCTTNQPAWPIIDALGKRLPERQISISVLSLVIQDGPEREWKWTIIDSITLLTPARR
jgi:hypothetical protein